MFYETSKILWILFRKYFKYVRKYNALDFHFDHVQNNGHLQITDHNLPLCFVCVHIFFLYYLLQCTGTAYPIESIIKFDVNARFRNHPAAIYTTFFCVGIHWCHIHFCCQRHRLLINSACKIMSIIVTKILLFYRSHIPQQINDTYRTSNVIHEMWPFFSRSIDCSAVTCFFSAYQANAFQSYCLLIVLAIHNKSINVQQLAPILRIIT